MNQSFGRLMQVWRGLPMARRVVLVGMVGALAAIGVVMTAWSGQISYSPLYSGLDPQDSGAIVEDLRTRAIPFELGSGGTSILVPEAQVDQLRLDFAAQGLPKGGNVGFELMNGNSFTATDFVQRLNFQRGLQGELQRTIESLNAVQHARVHIVMPEKSLFVKDQTPPTASVVLQMRPGQRLETREVRGIAHLVSGAVEGLKDDNVSILDTSGAVLFDGSQLAVMGGSGASGTQLEMQQSYERNLESGLQQLLDRTLGAGRATVKASALLNFDRTETTTEMFSPGAASTPVARSASTVTEKYTTGAGGSTGTTPGAVANVPGAANTVPGAVTAAAANGTGTDYTRNESTTNFEVGKTSTKSVQAIGAVKRLSLSLLVDQQVPEAQATALQAAVKAAAGLDDARGDTMAVARFAFDRTLVDEATAAFKEEASRDQYMGYARMGLPVVAVIVGLVLFRMLIRSVPGGSSEGYRYGGGPQMALADGRVATMSLGGGEQQVRALPAPSSDARSEMEQHVTKLIATQPQMVSDVMQAWIREDA